MMKCNKCKEEIDFKDSVPNYWQEGEEGTQYKWNKVGSLRDYSIVCKNCGERNDWMPF